LCGWGEGGQGVVAGGDVEERGGGNHSESLEENTLCGGERCGVR